MNIVQRNSKGNNYLDYSLNIVNKSFDPLNSPRRMSLAESSNFKIRNLAKFRCYRDIYFIKLELKLLSLDLEINLEHIGKL